MFAVFEIAGFVAVLWFAIWLWRTTPRLVTLIAVRGGYAALAFVVIAAVIGVPLFFFRTNHLLLPSGIARLIAQAHHYLGHIFITLFVLYWPFLVVASLARPRAGSRRVVLGGLSVLCLLLFLVLSFTGYALPTNMPRELSQVEGAHVLRFFVLHVVAIPLLSVSALVLTIWRHRRAIVPRT